MLTQVFNSVPASVTPFEATRRRTYKINVYHECSDRAEVIVYSSTIHGKNPFNMPTFEVFTGFDNQALSSYIPHKRFEHFFQEDLFDRHGDQGEIAVGPKFFISTYVLNTERQYFARGVKARKRIDSFYITVEEIGVLASAPDTRWELPA